MVINKNTQPITVYYHMSTTNQSFIDMHIFLKEKKVLNNKFFLALYDPDLAGVNPRDKSLSQLMKQKIFRECMVNFWYFIREVVRIPDQGGAVSGGARYKLDRANLALNFGFIHNWNMFLEIPRQHGKTISTICWYLWVYLFRTTNSEIMFMNKKHEDSKMNLRRMKDIQEALPEYLQMNKQYNAIGKPVKANSNVESMTNIRNKNKITTKPGANSRAKANSLGRGCTMPMHWYDEYAFIPYNTIIYSSATPAYKRAADNAKKNNAPYGILLTTTPGDMLTDEGVDAFNTKEAATRFEEHFYDLSEEQLLELRNKNTESNFFYIRFTYQQLGSGAEYFKEMVKDLKKDWVAIRREVMLEWAKGSNNSPFTQQELDTVGRLVIEPIMKIPVCSFFTLNMYKQAYITRNPPIIGVDVSGGYQKDSSAISIIDSKTTDVIADFNCNYISTNDLAKVIYEIVTKYMPNAIVNVERNGGFGSSVLQTLIKSKIKRNLYYEIKDRIIEERYDGLKSERKTKKCRIYGLDETKNTRELLMEILRDRMDNHKNKFISPIIYEELCTLEVKKNGRIEHASNAHDDQIFAYLLALYVWYEGENLMERFGLEKTTIYTDASIEEEFGLNEEFKDISSSIDEDVEEVTQQINYINSNKTTLYNDWLDSEYNKDRDALNQLINNDKIAMRSYIEKYSMDPDELPTSTTLYTIPDNVFNDFYDDKEDSISVEQKRINNILNINR